MSKANAAAEPSMEEILASIRRIITDGDTAPAAPVTKTETPKSDAAIKPVAAAAPKPAAPKPAAPNTVAPKPAPAPKASEPASQDDIDAMLAAMDAGEDEPPPVPEVAEGGADDDEDALDLAMVRAAAGDDAAPVKSVPKAMPIVEVEEDLGFEEPVDEEPMAPVIMAPPPGTNRAQGVVRAPPSMAGGSPAAAPALLSQDTEASVAAAFSSLTQAIFSNEPRTIEDVMKELLRPMIKTWLDDNLPSVVERLVREEISRVARGRR